MGSATVPVAPVGVPPAGSVHPRGSPDSALSSGWNVFGGTPKTAGETPALPRATAQLRVVSHKVATLKRTEVRAPIHGEFILR